MEAVVRPVESLPFGPSLLAKCSLPGVIGQRPLSSTPLDLLLDNLLCYALRIPLFCPLQIFQLFVAGY